MKLKNIFLLTMCVLTAWLSATQTRAQGTTAFTYQGQLHDNGTNANGAYTMIFKLYDALTGGNQIGSGITNATILGNGLFSVNLDFGASAFNGRARWLDITVSNGVAQTLSPRVQVLPTPYAQFAAMAATVTNNAIMNAQLAGNAVNTTNIQNGAVTTALIANNAVTNRNLTANAVNATNIASGQVVKSLDGLTDAVSLTAGANVTLTTNGNVLQISAASGGNGGGTNFIPSIRVFVSSGTFIVPTGVTKIEVELWGGGGGGGRGYSVATNNDGTDRGYSGGGGGAGGYGWNVFYVTPGANYTVTTPVDTDGGQHGGTTSFGSLLSATGGSPGANATAGGDGSGGAGGIATGSLINFASGSGFSGGNNVMTGGVGGGFGGSVWRGGSGFGSGGDGSDGPGSGGGGGGPGSGGVASPGTGGGSGIVIVYF
jgi:hypothetical protein